MTRVSRSRQLTLSTLALVQYKATKSTVLLLCKQLWSLGPGLVNSWYILFRGWFRHRPGRGSGLVNNWYKVRFLLKRFLERCLTQIPNPCFSLMISRSRMNRKDVTLLGAGLEPPWFSILDWMNPRNSSVEEFLESDNLLWFICNARLTLNC